MKKICLFLLVGLIGVASFAKDFGADNLTISTTVTRLGGFSANDLMVVNNGSATIYGSCNVDTNTFATQMAYTNATPIKPGYPVVFKSYNQGKLTAICLQTLSGSSSAFVGSADLSGSGISAGSPVMVTNTVDVSIVNTAVVSIVSMPETEGPTAIAGTPQDFTAAWVDLGAEIDCDGFNSLVLWLNVDANNSVDMRIRALAKHTTAGADEYVLPIKTPAETVVDVSPHYYELTDDADQNIVLQWDVDNSLPFVQFQIQAGTVGATAGQIDGAEYTQGYK